MNYPKEYRRMLPHIQPDNAVFFITFRLAGSLPKKLLEDLYDICHRVIDSPDSSPKEKGIAKQEYFESIEEFLDKPLDGPVWLQQPEIADIVAKTLHYYDGKAYKLICYCIMSNHVHLVAYAFEKPVFQVMKSLKTYTANKANKILGRSGSFWHREYYDRVVRDKNDLSQKIKYTLNNPVKIGLVKNWNGWPYSYCNPKFVEE